MIADKTIAGMTFARVSCDEEHKQNCSSIIQRLLKKIFNGIQINGQLKTYQSSVDS